MLVAGIDIGAVSTKALILECKDRGQILSYSILSTLSDVTAAGETAIQEALIKIGVDQSSLKYIVATGYGRISAPFAEKAITEILCHAKGVNWLIPTARTVIDIGGQDSKAIKIDEHGMVKDFVMNDKCAAGTGRFLETMAKALGFEVTQFGSLSLKSKNPCQITSICTVFAESEVVSLRAEKKKEDDIVAGLHKAAAKRVAGMAKNIGFENDIVFTGGVAKNEGMKKALEIEIGTRISLPEEPQIVGALGAALFAREELQK